MVNSNCISLHSFIQNSGKISLKIGMKTIAILIIPLTPLYPGTFRIVLTDVSPTCFFKHGLNQGFGITGSQ